MKIVTGIFWCRCERAKTGTFSDLEIFVPAVFFQPNDVEKMDIFSILEKAVAGELGKDWELITYLSAEDKAEEDANHC